MNFNFIKRGKAFPLGSNLQVFTTPSSPRGAAPKTLKKIIFILLFLSAVSGLFSESSPDRPDKLFSLDALLMCSSIYNQGIGIGLRYEMLFLPHFSGTAGFAHVTMNTGESGIWCTTVRFLLASSWYPLSKNMEKLYVTGGSGFDYVSYFGDVEKDKNGDNPSDMLLFAEIDTGWKQYFSRTVIFDIFCGYKFVYSGSTSYGSATENYIHSGMQYGIRMQKTF